MFLSRGQLIGAIAIAAILAVPIVTFVSAMVVFPILFFAALAIVANVTAPLLLLERGLRPHGRGFIPDRMAAKSEFVVILWLGCAYGLSRWGDAARSMGAKNLPYFEVLFAPVLMLFGVKIG